MSSRIVVVHHRPTMEIHTFSMSQISQIFCTRKSNTTNIDVQQHNWLQSIYVEYDIYLKNTL